MMEINPYVKDLLKVAGNKIPLIRDHENFLLKADKLKSSNVYLISTYVNPANNERFTRRPQNGIFIAIPRYLKAEVADLSSAFSRLQAVILKTNYRNMLPSRREN